MQNLTDNNQEKNKIFNFFSYKKTDIKPESFLKTLIFSVSSIICMAVLTYSSYFFESLDYIEKITRIENQIELNNNKQTVQLFTYLQKKSLANIQISLNSISRLSSIEAHTKTLPLLLNNSIKINNKYSPEYKMLATSYLLGINSINYEIINLSSLNIYKNRVSLTN